MSENNQIYSLIPKVMEDIGNIGKEQRNNFHKYQFRGIDDVLNHCGPVFRKHGVTPEFRVVKHSFTNPGTGKNSDGKLQLHVRVKAELRLYAPDGSLLKTRLTAKRWIQAATKRQIKRWLQL